MFLRFILTTIAVVASSVFSDVAAEENYSLDDLAFLTGAWRGGEGFVFEEIWSHAEGGVMTGMARGVASGELRVLEYIVVSEEDAGVIMRFKHYNADFTTWEDDEPIMLALTSASDQDATFTADPPSQDVKSIRYWMPDADTLQAEVVLVEDGEEGGFTLTFKREDN
ncbi:DUF6265 family protein [Hyphococcus flavus]|uniref:DUF6265 family protein n=1 Tax=Hyphococcus flavus TaxID=1866326 RepID=A0AAF0CGS6_9PROT|nr:DUF6265 family protein [Hyphococcus flavus]WDI32578.1 DUF6265 family protein [Hyphococcus flavus]